MASEEAQKATPHRRVLLFPLPFQGHINPMFQLANLLHSRGFAITILHTHFNSPDPARHPNYDFIPIPDGLPPDLVASENVIEIVLALNKNLEEEEAAAYLRDRIGEVIMVADEEEPVACLVIDGNWLAVQKVAAKLGLPTLVLRTGNAVCFDVYLAYPMLCQKGYLPLQESKSDIPVSELPPLRAKDLFFSSQSTHENMCECLARIVQTVKNSSGVLFNTFDALEHSVLEKIRHELSITVLAVGPLHKLTTIADGSLLAQDRSCLKWLDEQAAHSVLYVSFGSLASMQDEELVEVAWGLANSGQPFLWVVRPGLVRNSQKIVLPDGFEDEIDGRGKIINWAPQLEVLNHQAVGGFWTHNGWNSTLESISDGVPMLCRPQFTDQMLNARYVEKVWRFGFEAEGKLERRKIEQAVKILMRERDGAEMRERARELKNKAAQAIGDGGSSSIAIQKLVDHILSL